MKSSINLNAELREWFDMRICELIADNPQAIDWYYLDLDEAKKDLIQIVYERLYKHPDKVKKTADFFCIDRRTIYNYAKKYRF